MPERRCPYCDLPLHDPPDCCESAVVAYREDREANGPAAPGLTPGWQFKMELLTEDLIEVLERHGVDAAVFGVVVPVTEGTSVVQGCSWSSDRMREDMDDRLERVSRALRRRLFRELGD